MLRIVRNETPFSHFDGQKAGPGRALYDCLVVKASFVLDAGVLELAERNAPIVLADRYWAGRPAARSSIREPGEHHLAKPGTDVVVLGSARSPRGKPRPSWTCRVAVRRGPATIVDHSVVATGPRRFKAGMFGKLRATEPEPTVETPIRYELAYGGSFVDPATTDQPKPRYLVHRENPAGLGFVDPNAPPPDDGHHAPRWELPGEPVETINQSRGLAGFGPVARMWAARARFAGTYDEAWKRRQIADQELGLTPDYPGDFDPRFFHVAHPAMTTPSPLVGGETVYLGGFLADAPELVFRLPPLRPEAELLQGVDLWNRRPFVLDKLQIDLDHQRVDLVWRLQLAPGERAIAAFIHAVTWRVQ